MRWPTPPREPLAALVWAVAVMPIWAALLVLYTLGVIAWAVVRPALERLAR